MRTSLVNTMCILFIAIALFFFVLRLLAMEKQEEQRRLEEQERFEQIKNKTSIAIKEAEESIARADSTLKRSREIRKRYDELVRIAESRK